MIAEPKLALTSDPAGDILSTAASFKTEATVVWEYVANSLEYVESGVSPKVQVNVYPRKKRIEIHDNGSGMDEALLTHFFRMHSENLERKKGKPGRGKFGTGKSAAFGVANTLRITTRKNGMLNVVELTRDDIVAARGQDKVPVKHTTVNEKTDEVNGTSVEILDIVLPKIRVPQIVEYIERHLQHWRNAAPSVAVNDHVCQFRQPEVVRTIDFVPNEAQAKLVGNVVLQVHVSRTPLDDKSRGISITAGPGNLVGLEDAGVCSKEYGNYLFGEIDVPLIEAHESSIEPYDDSRSLQLNPLHPVVRSLVALIGASLESVRKELAESAKAARQDEVTRRLTQAADKIADALNEDFRKQTERLNEIRAASSRSGAATSLFGSGSEGDDSEDVWIAGVDEIGNVEKSAEANKTGGKKSRPAPDVPQAGEKDPEGSDSVSPAGGSGKRKRPKGGFQVVYEHSGADFGRSFYDSDTLRIIINLDHKVVKSALEQCGVEDIGFQRLSYEIAFSEYAMGLGVEMIKQDPDMPADDLLYEVRATLNRISDSAAALYV